MGIRDSLNRLRSTRVGKTSKYEKREHEEMAEKYEKKKKFQHKHNDDKPKSESLRDKLVNKALEKGKQLQEKSKQHAINELKKSKSKKNKTKKSKPKLDKRNSPTPISPFSLGFDNQSNEQFGFGMFTPQKQEGKPKQEEIDWSKIYDFRVDSKKKFNPFGSYYP